MTPAEWDSVADLFAEAVEFGANERRRFLDRQGRPGNLLRDEVERLLEEHDRTAGPLDRPLWLESEDSAAELRVEQPRAGRVLNGRYRIERFLTRGGTASVYLARDEHLAGKRVIAKFLNCWARELPWIQERLRHEMEALARIDHRGVVGVLDAGETEDGVPFLVVEYIDGVTLREEMQRGAITPARAARIIREIGCAASAAHARGVLHCDLKPENIMLEEPGTTDEAVRLIDFGIARLRQPEAAEATHTTHFAGTTQYMAPEQLRGKPGSASDIYAIGIVMHEMVTGQRPFAAASPVELYEQQKAGMPDGRKLPWPVARAIAKELSFRPERRSPSAAEAGESMARAVLEPADATGGVGISRRAAAAAIAGAVGCLGGAYAWRTLSDGRLEPGQRVVELPPASEPLEHGFQIRGQIDYRVVANADASGLDAIRVTTSDQGGYYHPLSPSQAAAASRRGWKMMFEARVEEGGISCHIDHPGAAHRYAINLLRTPQGRDMVRLPVSTTPLLQGMDWEIPGPPGHRHSMALVLDPARGAAELWVDGAKRLSGYQGMDDFRYRRGFEFGAAIYLSRRASGVIWKARLEIG